MSSNIQILGLILSILNYALIFLFIFNLMKVNYYNQIVSIFVKAYSPIAKIFSPLPVQALNILIIAIVFKLSSLVIYFGDQYEITTLIGVSVIQTIMVILRIIFFAVIEGDTQLKITPPITAKNMIRKITIIVEITTLIGVSVIQTIMVILRIIFFAVIGGVILSWVSPSKSNAFLELVEEISYKSLMPIRNYIPSAGGLDFSPLFVLILINLIESFLSDVLRSIV